MKPLPTHPRFSVIIPAANEEAFIDRALQSVRSQRGATYEIIVVINGSKDGTLSRISSYPEVRARIFLPLLGYSRARNEGARAASGDMLVFMDADSFMGPGVLDAIAHETTTSLGTLLGGPDTKRMLFRLFFMIKNAAHRLGLKKGVLGGVFFCDRELFERVDGYNEFLAVNEHADFIKRAVQAGGAYRLLTTARAYTSMRRFEKRGIIRALSFWIKIQYFKLLGREHEMGHEYASSHDRFEE